MYFNFNRRLKNFMSLIKCRVLLLIFLLRGVQLRVQMSYGQFATWQIRDWSIRDFCQFSFWSIRDSHFGRFATFILDDSRLFLSRIVQNINFQNFNYFYVCFFILTKTKFPKTANNYYRIIIEVTIWNTYTKTIINVTRTCLLNVT